jgi:3-oxoacyl-[acyl-carrier-protein] synthase-3
MSNILITGVGSYLPKKIITNNELPVNLDTNDEWIKKRTGIRQRHLVSDGELTSTMAIAAAKKALQNANIDNKDIDLIIVATTTPDKTFPATAVKVQSELNIGVCPAFDIQAVCAGFIYALNVGSSLLKTSNFSKALIIGSESFSKILDWSDRSTSVLFGDGAGAFVLEKSNENSEWGILSSNFYSNGNFSDILNTDGGPSINSQVGKVRMNGKEVFKHAVEKLSSCLIEAINSANLKIQDIDFLVPHQANLRIIEALSKKLDIPINKIINTVDVHANTSAASIPLAFDSALEKRIIKNGDIIAFNAIGGGLSWGASIIKYGKPD